MMEQLLSGIKQAIKDLLTKTWSASTSAGVFSLQYASAKVDGVIYLFGGRVGVSTTGRNGSWKYTSNAFTALANMPQTLATACAAAVGRKVYLFGGCSQLSNGFENKKVYIYDVDTNTFSTGTDMPVNCLVGSCAALGTDIYVYGGMASQVESGFPKLFYRYNTATGVWTSLTYHDGPAMLSTSIVAIGGLLYAFGGEYANATGNENDVRVFDPVAGTWSKLVVPGTKPSARGGCAVVKYDDTRFIVIGGRSGAGTNVLADAWVFDIVALTWTALPVFTKMAFHRAELVANNDVIVFDGYNSASITNGCYRLQ